MARAGCQVQFVCLTFGEGNSCFVLHGLVPSSAKKRSASPIASVACQIIWRYKVSQKSQKVDLVEMAITPLKSIRNWKKSWGVLKNSAYSAVGLVKTTIIWYAKDVIE